MLCGQWPFEIKSAECLRPQVHKSVVATVKASASWEIVSEGGKALVEGLLTVNPDDRLGVGQCKAHAWLCEDAEEVLIPRALSSAEGAVPAIDRISASTGDAV